MEVCPSRYLWWRGYFWCPWVSFVMADKFSVRVTKITSGIGIEWTHILPFWLSPLFNSMKWQYYQKDVNQINLNHTTLWNLVLQYSRSSFNFCGMWIFPWINHSRHSCSMWDKHDDLIDSENFSVKGYLPLIQKDSVIHMYGLQFMWRKGSLLHEIENYADSYWCFQQRAVWRMNYFQKTGGCPKCEAPK